MAKLIDAMKIDFDKVDISECTDVDDIIFAVENLIDAQPAVDAVPVVRCKDCKHYDNSEGIQWCHLNSKFYRGGFDWHSFPEDGFCSYGERRNNA